MVIAAKGLRNVWGRTGQDKMLLIWPPWDEQYWIRGWFLTEDSMRLGVVATQSVTHAGGGVFSRPTSGGAEVG